MRCKFKTRAVTALRTLLIASIKVGASEDFIRGVQNSIATVTAMQTKPRKGEDSEV